ncbi:MAG: response regulator transcription factor [Deltaproteobacteria bacterium]|nr:response regulator transcription factor [Deltaproteobacteria bacterium]
MRTVLVVDDDQRLRELLVEYLGARGWAVEAVEDGERALDRLRRSAVDLVVLDVMMPGRDGFEVLKVLRGFSPVPVIMLTARGDDTDRIVGLEIGADDYLPKPFNPRELIARMQAVLRRFETGAKGAPLGLVLRAGAITVDPERREASSGGAQLDLTTTEFEILRTLVANAGRVIPRERLMAMARGEEWAAFERSVDVHISHLRKKLGDDPRSPALIKTIRGVGYLMPKGDA